MSYTDENMFSVKTKSVKIKLFSKFDKQKGVCLLLEMNTMLHDVCFICENIN